jgi:hypothetical protein
VIPWDLKGRISLKPLNSLAQIVAFLFLKMLKRAWTFLKTKKPLSSEMKVALDCGQ